MQKIFLFIIAILLMLSMAACSKMNNDNEGSQDRQNENGIDAISSKDLNDEDLSGAAIVDSHNGSESSSDKADATAKQKGSNGTKEEGYEVIFGSDGSVKMENKETGRSIVQNSDGSWALSEKEKESGIVDLGAGWPDNEYTKILPQPKFDIVRNMDNGNMYIATATSATIAQVKAYVEACKEQGFTINDETNAQEVDTAIYSYTAENKVGYVLSVAFATGTTTIMVEKP